MVLYPGVGEEKKKVLKYATMASNAGILGNPVAEGIFGSMGLFYASFYLIPQRTAMWSLGMTYFTKAPDRKTLIKKICTHPCIVSVFIGFVLMLLQMQIPGFLGDTVHSLNKANTAVSMIFVGTVLAEADMKTMITPLSCYYAAVRLILIPALVWAGCLLFHIDTLVMGISVVLAAMPAASTTAILAAKYGGDEVFATKCVVFTTLLSMMSAPAARYLRWMSDTMSGRVRHNRSLSPFSCPGISWKISPRKSASVKLYCCIMVPIAPSRIRMRSRTNFSIETICIQ